MNGSLIPDKSEQKMQLIDGWPGEWRKWPRWVGWNRILMPMKTDILVATVKSNLVGMHGYLFEGFDASNVVGHLTLVKTDSKHRHILEKTVVTDTTHYECAKKLRAFGELIAALEEQFEGIREELGCRELSSAFKQQRPTGIIDGLASTTD